MAKKISPLLAGMLNDVEVITDEKLIEANDGVSEAVIALEEPVGDAVELIEGVEETEAAVVEVEAGLQNGLDIVSARLLVSNLNNAIKKLDGSYMVSAAGMQDDNQSNILQESLNNAKEILAIAKDRLKTVSEELVSKIADLDVSLSAITKWYEQSGATTEKAKESSEALATISELVEKIKDNQEALALPEETVAQVENIESNVETLEPSEVEEIVPTTDANEADKITTDVPPVEENADVIDPDKKPEEEENLETKE